MIQTITEYEFINQFNAVRPDNFSYAALQALFSYLEELEDDMGDQIEFDVIGLCCDYSEYTFDELREYYYFDLKDVKTDVDLIDYLQDRTTVISVDDNTVIIQDF